jgi:hypothetical protein
MFTSRLTTIDPDHFYLDLTILNNDTTGNKEPVFLTFSEQRDIPIIDDPQEWHLSVVRFHVDTPNMPLALFTVQTGQSDINKSIYSVTLKYGANEVQTFLNYSPMNQNARLPNPPLSFQDYSTGYYEIYSYSYFITLVNNAFQTCYNSLLALGALPSTVAPYFEWDPNSLKAILNSDILGYDLGISSPIEIYMNGPLFYLFSSLNAYYQGSNVSNGKNFKLNVRNINNGNIYSTSNPAINWLQLYQEFPTVGSVLNPVDAYVFTTTQIPVNSSVQAKPQIFNSTTNESQINTNQKTLNVLTDLIVGLDLGYENKPDILYNPTAEYRLISLQSNQPLRSYDISLYWRDTASNYYPFYLASGTSASIKIMFRKKGYQNYKLE